MALDILAVIPVKGRSIGLPGKNLRFLGDRPIFTHTIDHALESKLVTRVVVSTDSEEIATMARECGAHVPFMRPKHLTEPEVMYPPVICHALEMLAMDEYMPDLVVALSPMHPFRRDNLIDNVIGSMLEEPELDSVITASVSFFNTWVEKGGELVCLTEDIPQGSRQFRQPIYHEIYGLVSVFKPEVVLAKRQFGDSVSLYPVDDKVNLIDIDTEFDFWLAERIHCIFNPGDDWRNFC